MKIAFVVNVMDSDESGATTYRLAAECVNRGHETWILSTGSLAYNPEDTLGGNARTVPGGRSYTSRTFLQALRGKQAAEGPITLDDLDVLFLRSNPSVQRPWAQFSGIHFGRLATRRGVLVVNDPDGLARATNKLYLQNFPGPVRPRTLVTRQAQRIEEFLDEQETIILKPLQGSGGKGVFLVRRSDRRNLDDIINAVSRDGYVVAQEYLPAAAQGDTRLFLLNGSPLRWRGKLAAFRRVGTGADVRSNIGAGGKLRRARVTDEMLALADMVRPRLVADGMFLVGLDIAGDKLMEINVFNPGGLGSARMFEKVDFARPVIEALERKVSHARLYRGDLQNAKLATL